MEIRKLSLIQHEVLVGTLLGDACLKPNKSKTKYKLSILQSLAHKEYVLHLYDIFKEFVITPPKEYVFTDKRSPGKVYTRWFFHTTSQACFKVYGNAFYCNNTKIVPKCINKWLTPRAIAYWYMDDGSQKWKTRSLGVRFCTDSFSKSQVEVLISILETKYNLKCSTQKKQEYLRIYISSKSHTVLTKLISHFIIPSMLYKFPTRVNVESATAFNLKKDGDSHALKNK